MTESDTQTFMLIHGLKDAEGNRYYSIRATVSTNETITLTGVEKGLTTLRGVALAANEDVAVKCTYTGAIITITSTHTDKVISGLAWGI
jgi:hypothetical protein